MERDSFIFYKSFYEAITDLPKDIRLEVLTAIIEYALFGKTPENLKPFARGMFTLIKPNIDANTVRFINGSKGGSKSKKKTHAYSRTYDQEVAEMRADQEWKQIIRSEFNLSDDEYDSRLSLFLTQCRKDSDKKGKAGHDSADDARSHLRYWLSKAYPQTQPNTPPSNPSPEDTPPPEYTFNGGFGGADT